jgi:hypothetical protein
MFLKAHRLSLLTAALALVPAAAHAATPGVGHGTLMISAERLFGLSVSRATQGSGGGETHLDQTHFGLALAPLSPAPHVYLLPRLAFDFAIIDGLTLGGSIGFDVGDSDANDGAGPSFTTFLIAPRAGYVLGLSKVFNLWLRGGITYFNASSHTDPSRLPPNTDRSLTVWGVSLNLEPTLMISPFEHVAFTAGLLLDLPLAGKRSTENVVGPVTTTTSIDYSVRNIGLVAGMVVLF